MLGNAAPSPESSPHYALAHFRQELTWQHRGISYKLVIFRVAAAGTRAEGLGRRLRRGWGSCRRTAPATGVNNFSLFWSPEKASSEQKLLTLNDSSTKSPPYGFWVGKRVARVLYSNAGLTRFRRIGLQVCKSFTRIKRHYLDLSVGGLTSTQLKQRALLLPSKPALL